MNIAAPSAIAVYRLSVGCSGRQRRRRGWSAHGTHPLEVPVSTREPGHGGGVQRSCARRQWLFGHLQSSGLGLMRTIPGGGMGVVPQDLHYCTAAVSGWVTLKLFVPPAMPVSWTARGRPYVFSSWNVGVPACMPSWATPMLRLQGPELTRKPGWRCFRCRLPRLNSLHGRPAGDWVRTRTATRAVGDPGLLRCPAPRAPTSRTVVTASSYDSPRRGAAGTSRRQIPYRPRGGHDDREAGIGYSGRLSSGPG